MIGAILFGIFRLAVWVIVMVFLGSLFEGENK